MTTPQLVYAGVCSVGLGLLGLAAPPGKVLVGSPPAEKAVRDPSVRAGSSHGGHHWFFMGGGYHGGK